MSEVVLDTNFLMIPAVLRIDIYDEIARIAGITKVCTLDRSLDELKKLASTCKKAKERRSSELALEIALELQSTGKLDVIKTDDDMTVDDLLVKMSGPGLLVATQDKELKQRIRKRGGKIIVLRQKKYVQLVG